MRRTVTQIVDDLRDIKRDVVDTLEAVGMSLEEKASLRVVKTGLSMALQGLSAEGICDVCHAEDGTLCTVCAVIACRACHRRVADGRWWPRYINEFPPEMEVRAASYKDCPRCGKRTQLGLKSGVCRDCFAEENAHHV